MSVKERGADDELNRIDEELSDDPPGLLLVELNPKVSNPANNISTNLPKTGKGNCTDALVVNSQIQRKYCRPLLWACTELGLHLIFWRKYSLHLRIFGPWTGVQRLEKTAEEEDSPPPQEHFQTTFAG